MLQTYIEDVDTSYDTLKESINKRHFCFMYQPILNIKNEEVGFEMLARWQHKGQWISPMKFIPAIEESGLINDFNKLLVDQMVVDLHKLRSAISKFAFISLNLSPYVFKNNQGIEFMDYLNGQLHEHNIKPGEVCLEITESSMLNFHAMTMLEEYKKQGFLIAIDDFGTGFSSMEYLIGHSFNVLKLDITLIRQITTNPRQIAIVETVLLLSKKLSFRVIAEGVETQEQYDLLKAIGIDYVQGYFISKPAFIESIEKQT